MSELDKVLVIDDDPHLRRTLTDVLEIKGFHPLQAGSGRSALELIRQERCAVALVDLRLEDMPGMDVVRAIRDASPDTECILLTGYASQDSAIAAINLGAYSYSEKPFDMERLLVSIRHAVERRASRKALARSEARLSSIFQVAPIGIGVIQQRVIEQVNSRLCEMTGYAESELIGRSARVLYPSDQEFQRVGRDKYDDIRRQGFGAIETLWRRKDGEIIDVLLTSTPLVAGDLAGLVTFTALEITERKRAEAERERLVAEIMEQAQRVQGILDTVPDGVLLLDGQGRLLRANPVAQKYLELLAPVRAAPAGSDPHPERITELAGRPLTELMAAPPPGYRHELEVDGHTFELSARLMAGADESSHWVVVLSDVTEQRQQQRYQQSQERLATVGQLAAGIAHDFNNTLGAITLYAGLLAKTAHLDPQGVRYLNTISGQADSAANLVSQILDFGRRAPMERATHDLMPMIHELAQLLLRTVPETIRIEVKADRAEYAVLVDPTRLQQALMNLALNARDAMPQGGQLLFDLSSLRVGLHDQQPLPDVTPGEWVRLQVRDTGCGISAQHKARLFEPFFTTKGPGQGTGLGLAQVYGIVKQHAGAIDVQSQEGQGTVVTIYLPCGDGDMVSAEPQPQAETGTTGQGTILLAEDNQATREAVAEVLQGLGYEVITAASGAEALNLLTTQAVAVDLVLSDLVMPEMGGIELRRRLREARSPVRLLFMTGYPLDQDEGELLPDETPWIQKPFSIAELAAKVRAVLA